jgi:hypothetical protein
MMPTKYTREIRPGSGSRELLFQQLAGKWYAIMIEDPDKEPLFVSLPEGVTPEDKNFCFVSLFDNGLKRSFDRSA